MTALVLLAAMALDTAAAPVVSATPIPAIAPVVTATPLLSAFSGSVGEDVRLAFPQHGAVYEERARSELDVRAEATPSTDMRAVLDARLVWLGTTPAGPESVLSDPGSSAPFWLDADAAFVEVNHLAGTKLRLRMGRQTLRWGSGLLFNPTSLLNPPDLEDPLRYGAPLGTEMVRIEWMGPVHIDLIGVPGFRPALLPLIDERQALEASGIPGATTIAGNPAWTIAIDDQIPAPPSNADGMQGAARISGRIPGIDLDAAVMGYIGRTHLPQLSSANLTLDPVALTLTGTATLDYPRMSALGIDLARPLPFLDLGAWFEGAWNVPVPETQTLVVDGVTSASRVFTAPYLRVATGLDRRFEDGLYLNAQFVRGFPQEFGKPMQGDYLVGVGDYPFAGERFHARIVAAYDLDDTSWLGAPEIDWTPDALTLAAGAWAGFGTTSSRFGGPLTGPPIGYVRVKVSF